MLQREFIPRFQGVVFIMNDTALVASVVKTTLQDIARQANALGTGLQNAALGDKSGTPNNSVQYLLDIASDLSSWAEKCDTFVTEKNE